MSDAIFNQIAGGMIALNDSLREAFLPSGARLFLIKPETNSGIRWTLVKELTTGWFIEFSEYRGLFKLLYATLDPGFTDELAQASFIAYGVPNDAFQVEVFSIDPERRDIVPPVGTSPFWKVYVAKEEAKRYTVRVLSPPSEAP